LQVEGYKRYARYRQIVVSIGHKFLKRLLISVTFCCVFSMLLRIKIQIAFYVQTVEKRFWATVCKTVRPMLSDRCLSCPVCLSVALVYCGQTVRWIKMKLGLQVSLGPGHIVLDADPSPPPKGHSTLIFGPCLLWPNGRPSQLLLSTCSHLNCFVSLVCKRSINCMFQFCSI